MPASMRGFGLLLGVERQRQKRRKPSRCQRRTVSGLTSNIASRQCGSMLPSMTSKPRSNVQSSGRLTARAATMSCWRSKAFSAMSSACERVMSAMKPVTTPLGRHATHSAARARVTSAVARERMRARKTSNTPTQDPTRIESSRLVRRGNVNDHAPDHHGSQNSQHRCRRTRGSPTHSVPVRG